jgi:alcohol dehydrogenase (NADP+)
MPVKALGTWRADPALLPAALDAALEAGVRHIDTAAMYGNETIIGAALNKAISEGRVTRGELFVATKLMPTDAHIEHVIPALEKSLAQLNLGHIDLYMLHWPYRFKHNPTSFPVPVWERLGYVHEDIMQVWRLLEAEVDKGRIKALGVSNFTPRQLAPLLRDARHKPQVNQLELHPLLQSGETVAFCKENGIAVTAYCPLGSPNRPPNMRLPTDPQDVLQNPTLQAIAAARGSDTTVAQVVLRWHLQRGVLPLPKSVTADRIRSNAAFVDIAELTASEMESIAKLDLSYRLCRGEQYAVEGQTWEDLWR